MKFIAGKANAEFIEDLHRAALQDDDCGRILAAVAYADSLKFFEMCDERDDIPLTFYGRYDWTVPISPEILKWFLDQSSANFTCKLVADILHSKVIWWKGVGAYIGSANFSVRAWYTNIEAGTYFSQSDLELHGIDQQLEDFFKLVEDKSVPLTHGILQEQIKQKNRIRETADHGTEKYFDKERQIKKQPGLISVEQKRKGNDGRFIEFEKEWNSTLEIIRLIAKRVSAEGSRPDWIPVEVPAGAQADQFLHAYYFDYVRDGVRYPFEDYFNKNEKNPEKALVDAIRWWKEGNFDHAPEKQTLLESAPKMRMLFARDRITNLTRDEFVDGISHVFALRVHAKQMEAEDLGLEAGPHDRDKRAIKFAERLWNAKTKDGRSILPFLHEVIWGSSNVAERLWRARPDQKGIPHLGINSLAELIGWARPDDYPPRNQRTSKALRALGYPVKIV